MTTFIVSIAAVVVSLASIGCSGMTMYYSRQARLARERGARARAAIKAREAARESRAARNSFREKVSETFEAYRDERASNEAALSLQPSGEFEADRCARTDEEGVRGVVAGQDQHVRVTGLGDLLDALQQLQALIERQGESVLAVLERAYPAPVVLGAGVRVTGLDEFVGLGHESSPSVGDLSTPTVGEVSPGGRAAGALPADEIGGVS